MPSLESRSIHLCGKIADENIHETGGYIIVMRRGGFFFAGTKGRASRGFSALARRGLAAERGAGRGEGSGALQQSIAAAACGRRARRDAHIGGGERLDARVSPERTFVKPRNAPRADGPQAETARVRRITYYTTIDEFQPIRSGARDEQ